MTVLQFFQPAFFFVFVFSVLALFMVVGFMLEEVPRHDQRKLFKAAVVLALVVALSSTVAFMDEPAKDDCVCRWGKIEELDAGK